MSNSSTSSNKSNVHSFSAPGASAPLLSTLVRLAAPAAALILLSACAALENKAVGISGAVDAVKLETTGSASSGSVLPNITIGGAVSSIATSPLVDPGKTSAPVYTRSRRNSFFGDLFGVSNGTESVSYIGVPGESAADTAARVKAFDASPPAK